MKFPPLPHGIYPICSFCLSSATSTAFEWRRTLIAPTLPPSVQQFLKSAQKAPASACIDCARFIRAKDINGLRFCANEKYRAALARASTMKERLAAKSTFQNALLKQHLYWTSLAETAERQLDIMEYLPPGFLAFFDIISSGRFDETESTVFFQNGTEFAIMTDDMTLQPETLVSHNRLRGNGDAVIRLLCAAADHRGCRIEMLAEPFQRAGVPLGPDLAGLMKWYAKHGFTPMSGSVHPGAMRRTPDPTKRDRNESALEEARKAVSFAA